MAISKSLTDEDGIELTYHRVVRIDSVVTSGALIEVASYLGRASREAQLAHKEDPESGNGRPYISTSFVELPYADGMTASDAYAALKEMPRYEGASDVWEEGQIGANG